MLNDRFEDNPRQGGGGWGGQLDVVMENRTKNSLNILHTVDKSKYKV